MKLDIEKATTNLVAHLREVLDKHIDYSILELHHFIRKKKNWIVDTHCFTSLSGDLIESVKNFLISISNAYVSQSSDMSESQWFILQCRGEVILGYRKTNTYGENRRQLMDTYMKELFDQEFCQEDFNEDFIMPNGQSILPYIVKPESVTQRIMQGKFNPIPDHERPVKDNNLVDNDNKAKEEVSIVEKINEWLEKMHQEEIAAKKRREVDWELLKRIVIKY